MSLYGIPFAPQTNANVKYNRYVSWVLTPTIIINTKDNRQKIVWLPLNVKIVRKRFIVKQNTGSQVMVVLIK